MSQVATSRMLVAVGLVVAGCNQVFDIGLTIPLDAAPPGLDAADVDQDDDLILDIVDNCVAIANPLQEDQDDDDIGDMCDACPEGSNETEDTDSHLDGCDNCPGIANEDQLNSDNDKLGDACDPNAGEIDARLRFDGFALLREDWIPGGVEWEVVAGSVHMETMPTVNDHGLWNRRIEVTGTGWMIETRVVFQQPFTADDYAAIQSRDSVGNPDFSCYLQYEPPNWITAGQSATPASVTLDADNSARIRMYYSGTAVTCNVNGVPSMNVAVPPPYNQTHPGITANTTRAHFQYVDTSSIMP